MLSWPTRRRIANAAANTMTGILQLADKSEVPVVDGLTMGRVKGCDVVLDDTKASRKHARIIVEGSVVEIEDLGSSNGTYLNGQKIKRRVLRPGDAIRIGKTEMIFREAGAAGSSAAEEDGELDLGGDDDFDVGEPAPSPPPSPRDVPGVVGLEGDPVQATEPAPEQPPPREDDVEVLEFVDEVVEVRRREDPKPAKTAPSAKAPAEPVSAGGREGGVLQFSKKVDRGGLLGDDMAQMSTAKRLMLGVLALAVAGGLGYVAMMAAR